MSRLRINLRILVLLLLAGLLPRLAVAQVNSLRPALIQQRDPFALIHESLSDAAERTLALALADKPWMKTPEASPAVGRFSTSVGNDPVARFRVAVDRVNQLRPVIEPILREEGVPADLSAVVLVESGGLRTALSPKGARGIWQFMPDTARRYGLVVSAGRDDRLDIAKSTRAAARYLRDLHQQFGDWRLAFAAYNAGEEAVGRVLKRRGQRDFSALQHALPLETRNYVPAVLQAMSLLAGTSDEGKPALSAKRSGRILYASPELKDGQEF